MKAALVGSGGAIGGALIEALLARPQLTELYSFGRRPSAHSDPRLRWQSLDIGYEATISAAAATVQAKLDLLIIATGTLHGDYRGASYKPEKALSQLSGDSMAALFTLNTIGPALVLRYFAGHMRRDAPALMAALSARVGSIGDNRLGGWYSYRASKAALNMVIKTASIELGRRAAQLQVVGLHPGTVDSALSEPFQAGVATDKLFTPQRSASALLAVVDQLLADPVAANSGRCFGWDGAVIPA